MVACELPEALMRSIAATRTAVHVYQRSEGHFVLFYTRSDLLSFYTILSVCSRKTGVRVLASAAMYDHLHHLIEASSREEVTAFVRLYSLLYAKEFNRDSGLSGRLFEAPFGTALKIGDKDIRTCAGYVYNNHTNKKLCSHAEDIRWNYLAYAHSGNPFYEPLIRRKASRKLQAALKIADAERKAERPLNHATLRRMFSGLAGKESEQLTDYIIASYRFVDYDALESLYRSHDEMIYSFNANTFNDYDVSEPSHDRRGDDTVYREMAEYVLRTGRYPVVKDILKLPDKEKIALACELKSVTHASFRQIGAYLRIKLAYAGTGKVDDPGEEYPI